MGRFDRFVDSDEGAIVKRKNINDLVDIKRRLIADYAALEELDDRIKKTFDEMNAYDHHRLDFSFGQHNRYDIERSGQHVREIDLKCWRYLVKLYQLEKYMLCTDYSKMDEDLCAYKFPEFTEDNAYSWLGDLKHMVYASVKKLIEDVFDRITTKTYYTGSSYSTRQEKKRNNNGVDKHFILTTYDINRLTHWSDSPTITDDLEKACYIIDGKKIPDNNILSKMRSEKIKEDENDYFRIKVFINGNTHYYIKPEIRAKLNKLGASNMIIGEDVRIKIFEK